LIDLPTILQYYTFSPQKKQGKKARKTQFRGGSGKKRLLMSSSKKLAELFCFIWQ